MDFTKCFPVGHERDGETFSNCFPVAAPTATVATGKHNLGDRATGKHFLPNRRTGKHFPGGDGVTFANVIT